MKATLQRLTVQLALLFIAFTQANAQGSTAAMYITLTTPVQINAVTYQFQVLAAGGPGYVPDPCVNGCNKDGSWLTIDVRFDPPAGTTNVNYSIAPAAGYSVANAPAPILGNAVCYTGQVGVGFQLIRNGGTPDLPLYPAAANLATVTVSSPTGGGLHVLRTTQAPCQSRQTFWANPHPDNIAANARLTVTNAPIPLNINLLSFTATATPERTAKLEWQTGSEKNSSHFIVERSADGMRFTEQVARMQAAGTSNDLMTYHNFDYKPLTGNNYYRLKMVSKDGSFKYSETRRLVFEAPIADVAAIPNPFQSATKIRISADQAQMANYYVVDLAGRVIKTGVWEVAKGVQEFPMPLEDAAAGNYILTVQGSTILAEVRLTKSN